MFCEEELWQAEKQYILEKRNYQEQLFGLSNDQGNFQWLVKSRMDYGGWGAGS